MRVARVLCYYLVAPMSKSRSDLPPGAVPAAPRVPAMEYTLPSARPPGSPSEATPRRDQRGLANVKTSPSLPPLRLPAPAMTSLKGEVLEQSAQHVRVRYPVNDGLLDPYGMLQGGFLAAMMDNVVGMVAQASDPSRQSSTLEMSVRFFRSIRTGHVLVEGSMLRAGRTTLTIECVARDDANQLCAKSIATNMFLG